VPEILVTIANGSKMASDSYIPQVVWWTQGHTFTTSARVLNLQNYDMVLDMDWLEQFSPMWIHWKKKTMRFTHNSKRILLQGVKDCTSRCSPLNARKLKGMLKKGSIQHLVQLSPVSAVDAKPDLPAAVHILVQANAELFHKPTGLPPQRCADHQIPLIHGAQAVNSRPYRYTAAQKDEIEKQVKEMLQNGVIQPSASPFSSPVLLVKKKDGSWRFCIDYRRLNSITVKNKYPLPIVDELLDELKGACWFTKLDLRSGYHQVRLKPQDIPKTAFKTHHGHWEFKVMPFGLTNTPATFQELMNTVLAPVLRKYALVFVDDILIYSGSLEEHIQHLAEVFSILKEHKLYLKQSKCSFAQQSLEYLGHIISSSGVATDPDKVQAVAAWPVPTDVRQLRGFLGLS
jgi:hypothetical protein